MKGFAIAMTGLLEHLRDRFVLVAVVGALLMIVFSLVLGSLSFEEQLRILLHFGFLAIHLTCIGISLFLGAFVIQREIDKQTCLLTLVRPLNRSEFLLGKWLGIFLLEVVIWVALGLVLLFLLSFKLPFLPYMKAMIGTLLEAMILLSFSMLASLFVRPILALVAGVGLFLLGHWQPDLMYFAQKSENPAFEFFAQATQYIVPQFHRMNWRSFHLIANNLIDAQWLKVVAHGVFWAFFFLVLTSVRFRRRDLV